MFEEKTRFVNISSTGHVGRKIAYDLLAGNPDKPGLFWLSGFKSTMRSQKVTELASWCKKYDHSLCRFDYSGHGESAGEFEQCLISDWLEEAVYVFEKLSTGPQILIGSSMGGWLALLLLEHLNKKLKHISDRVKGCILIAPAWNMTEALMWNRFPENIREELIDKGVYWRPSAYGDGPYAITRKLIEDGRKHCIELNRYTVQCPIRIIHGMRDPDVPWQHSMSLIEQMQNDDITLHLIKDGEHRLSRSEDMQKLFGTLQELVI